MKKISRAGACLERSMIRLFLEEQERIAKTCDDMISFTVGEPDFIAPPMWRWPASALSRRERQSTRPTRDCQS